MKSQSRLMTIDDLKSLECRLIEMMEITLKKATKELIDQIDSKLGLAP